MSNYTPPRHFTAEGARIALVTCLDCGAALTIDPDYFVDVKALHDAWHERLEGHQADNERTTK